MKRGILLIGFWFLGLNLFAQEAKLILPIGHTDVVNSVNFSPDGKRVVTSSNDNTAKVWDTNSGTILLVLNANKEKIYQATFTSDGRKIMTISWGWDTDSGYSFKLWDALTGVLINEIKGHTSAINSISVSNDGLKTIASPNKHSLKIWDSKSGNEIAVLKDNTNYLWGAYFSPDGKKVVTTYSNDTAKIWDANLGISLATLEGHYGGVRSASFSPDGKKVVTASLDNTAKIWDTQSGNLLLDLKGHTNWVLNVIFSPDGKKIATASRDNTVKVWDSQNGVLLANIKGQSFAANSNPFSLDGKKIVTIPPTIIATVGFAESKNVTTANPGNGVKIWDTQTGLLLTDFIWDDNVCNNACFSPDGKKVITIVEGKIVKIWNVDSKSMVAELKGHTFSVNRILFTPDNKKIATSLLDSVTKIWDIEKGNLLVSFKGPKKAIKDSRYTYFQSIVFSSDSKKIAIGYMDNINIWDLNSGLLLDTKTNIGSIESFTQDNKNTVCFLYPNVIKILEAKNGNTQHRLNEDGKVDSAKFRNYYFSPDASRLITSDIENSYIRLWDVNSGQLIAKIAGHTIPAYDITFSPNGKKIVTADSNNIVKIWDVQTGKLLANLNGHIEKVITASFSYNNDKIVTLSKDKTVKIWDVQNGNLLLSIPISDNIDFTYFSPDDKKIITYSLDGIAKVWNAKTGTLLSELKDFKNCYKYISFYPDSKRIIETSGYSSTPKVWDAGSGNLLALMKTKGDGIRNYQITSDFKYLASVSFNNIITIWDANTYRQLYSFIPVDSTDYLVTDPYGRYDGTEGARKLLYFTCGTEVIGLDQVKDQLWVPNLAERIMKGDSINAKKLSDLDICGLIPQVEKEDKTGYHFMITPQRGGLGETVLYVNDIEVKRYKATQLLKTGTGYELNVTDKELQPYFIAGQENPVTVKAFTAKNDISSRGAKIIQDETKKQAVAPNLYAVMIGVSDYKGAELQLKYAAKDATDISDAVKSAAGKLLGNEHVFTYNLTTGANHYQLPEKIAVKNVLQEIGKKANANDILMIFFAGHGVTSGEKKQFYFLTADASQASATDAPDQVGISTAELSEWMKPSNIKAQKRILILDACNSGQAINELVKVGNADQNYLAARNDDKAEQIKAIDKLNEKSGLFILAASASNQSAYEMGRYSQGLLTYALLKAIKQQPDILEDNKYLNVNRWFNAAEKTVSDMVRETGNRQEPQIVSAGNFNVGLVDQEVMAGIKLANEKPLFTSCNFQNSALDDDNLDVSGLINKNMYEISARNTDSQISYVTASNSPDAWSLSGRYEIQGEDITIKINIKQNKEIKNKLELKGKKGDLKTLADQVVNETTNWILKNK